MKTDNIAIMPWASTLLTLWLAFAPCGMQAHTAQQDTVLTEVPDTDIRLNSNFQKELYKAFQLEPTSSNLNEQSAVPLDRQQLHEWVGKVADDYKPKAVITIPGLEKALNDVYIWRSPHNRYGLLTKADGTSCINGLDVAALGRYIRPAEIKIRKSKALAASARPLMNKILPMEGLPSLTLADSAVYLHKGK